MEADTPVLRAPGGPAPSQAPTLEPPPTPGLTQHTPPCPREYNRGDLDSWVLTPPDVPRVRTQTGVVPRGDPAGGDGARHTHGPVLACFLLHNETAVGGTGGQSGPRHLPGRREPLGVQGCWLSGMGDPGPGDVLTLHPGLQDPVPGVRSQVRV